MANSTVLLIYIYGLNLTFIKVHKNSYKMDKVLEKKDYLKGMF